MFHVEHTRLAQRSPSRLTPYPDTDNLLPLPGDSRGYPRIREDDYSLQIIDGRILSRKIDHRGNDIRPHHRASPQLSAAIGATFLSLPTLLAAPDIPPAI